jgi:hypothetical protein
MYFMLTFLTSFNDLDRVTFNNVSSNVINGSGLNYVVSSLSPSGYYSRLKDASFCQDSLKKYWGGGAGTHCSEVADAVCYKLEGRGFEI